MSFPNTKLILLIVSLFCLSGCASRAASPRTAANIDLCSLVSREEAAAALGGDVEVTSKAGDKVCAYSLAVTDPSRDGSIVVMVVTSDSVEFQKFGTSKDARTQATLIAGIGDKAVLFTSRERPEEGAKAMQVLKGNAFIAIGMSSTVPVSEDVLKTLAAKALSRLPS